MLRRLLILLLFGLVIAGGAAIAWQARGQARLVEGDLTAARRLLAGAGGFHAGRLEQRLDLIKQAEAHTVAAQHRLDRWPLRQLGALPLIGRDPQRRAAAGPGRPGRGHGPGRRAAGAGRRRPAAAGAFQSLPPPVGITQLPPPVAEPPATGVAPPAQVDTAGRLAAARRHPLRLHPRPAERAGASGRAAATSARPAAAGTKGEGQGGSGTTTRPPVTPPAVEAAPVARVRVPSAEVRVTPPAVLGRDLPDVRVRTPEVRVDAATTEAPRLRLS